MSEQSSKLIKDIIQRHHLSIAELSRIANVSRFSIYRYLEGKNIHPKKARAFSDALWKYKNDPIPFQKFLE